MTDFTLPPRIRFFAMLDSQAVSDHAKERAADVDYLAEIAFGQNDATVEIQRAMAIELLKLRLLIGEYRFMTSKNPACVADASEMLKECFTLLERHEKPCLDPWHRIMRADHAVARCPACGESAGPVALVP